MKKARNSEQNIYIENMGNIDVLPEGKTGIQELFYVALRDVKIST